MLIIGIKENILELIKKHEGLTYNGIEKFYNKEYPDKLNISSVYKFLQRLREDELIYSVSETEKAEKGKHFTYKPTVKAYQKQETIESKYSKLLKGTRNLHTVMVNRMDFTESPTKNEKENLEKIEELIENEPTR